MRTSLLMIALAGVFAVSAAHAQSAPANAAGSTKAAPAKPNVKSLGSSFGELIKAAAAQQQAQRKAKTEQAVATQVALDAKPQSPDAVRSANAVADTKTPTP